MIKHSYLLPLSLFALFTAPFLFAAPSNALKHDIKTLPVLKPQTFTSSVGSWQGYQFSLYGHNFPESLTGSKNQGLVVNYNTGNNKCELGTNSSGRDHYNLISNNYGTNEINGFVGTGEDVLAYNSTSYSRSLCFIHTDPFGGNLTIPNILPSGKKPEWGSPSSVLYNGSLYAWDHIYLSHSQSINGVVSDYNLRSADLTRDYLAVKDVSEFTIPFDVWDQSKFGPLTEGRSIRIAGGFYFKNGGSLSHGPILNNLGSNAYVKLSLRGVDPGLGGSSYTQESPNCSWSNADYGEDFEVSYSCELILDRDWSSDAIVQLAFRASSATGCDDHCYLWKFSSDSIDWYFRSAYFVTDNDYTPGPDYGNDCKGSDCSTAPGSGVRDPDGGDDDWFSSLVGMFRFNALNPFQPIFNMFNNPSGCVNIPIIAGMLNSTETTYCTWFPTSVRSVLTPVLSMASIMLVFGFFVRWLGSSSGNFFEDSKGETVSWSGRKSKK